MKKKLQRRGAECTKKQRWTGENPCPSLLFFAETGQGGLFDLPCSKVFDAAGRASARVKKLTRALGHEI